MGEGPWPCDDITEFSNKLHENQLNADKTNPFTMVKGKLDIINYSTIPWIQYTGFVRVINNAKVENAPKLSFGKFFRDSVDQQKIWMPVSNQSHHGLMDGRHVGMFFETLQNNCKNI